MSSTQTVRISINVTYHYQTLFFQNMLPYNTIFLQNTTSASAPQNWSPDLRFNNTISKILSGDDSNDDSGPSVDFLTPKKSALRIQGSRVQDIPKANDGH